MQPSLAVALRGRKKIGGKKKKERKSRSLTISLHRKYPTTILSLNSINIHFVLQYPGPSLVLKTKAMPYRLHVCASTQTNSDSQTSAWSPH